MIIVAVRSLKLQRELGARGATYQPVVDIAVQHGGGMASGLIYSQVDHGRSRERREVPPWNRRTETRRTVA